MIPSPPPPPPKLVCCMTVKILKTAKVNLVWRMVVIETMQTTTIGQCRRCECANVHSCPPPDDENLGSPPISPPPPPPPRKREWNMDTKLEEQLFMSLLFTILRGTLSLVGKMACFATASVSNRCSSAHQAADGARTS